MYKRIHIIIRINGEIFSDYIGRPNIYTIFFVIQIIAYFTLPVAANVILFQVLVFFIVSCYGGGFSSVPAYIGDIFGTKQLGAIHGYILTAWAMGGVVGPMLLSLIYDSTHSYNITMIIFGIIFVLAFILSMWIRVDMKRLREKQDDLTPPTSGIGYEQR